ncbi:S-adenosyl-L-methionine-dependent methyltransferase [Trichoderma ceciliae]
MDAEDGTVPLDETFAETVNHHGRIFQSVALANNIYFAPIDEDEIARLGEMHSMLRTVFDNRLIFPPVSRPGTILECGFGAANWAIDVAEQYPDAEIVGLDISPHMIPEETPDNLDLQVDDLNGEFTFPSNHFDVVHSQMMAGGIHASRWRSYLKDIYRVLQPGGWCQLVEIYFNAQSDNGTLSPDHALSRWSSGYLDAMHPQKDPRAALRLKDWMRSAGFSEIESRLLTLPMCPWPSDPRDHEIGALNVSNVSQLLYSTGLYPFTHTRGMSLEDFQLLVAQARNEASNPSYRVREPPDASCFN